MTWPKKRKRIDMSWKTDYVMTKHNSHICNIRFLPGCNLAIQNMTKQVKGKLFL